MIISENKKQPSQDFENLLQTSHSILTQSANSDPRYYMKRNSTEFENDVFECMRDASRNTPFENTIELISGYKFPDIIAQKVYGVEVKTTKQNHWRSTGNSVLETTRIDDVSSIYIFFARLSKPPKFKFRKYQDCLYDIAVTHSPRYLIDMETTGSDNIFNKMGIQYDLFRNLDNPIKHIIKFYRSTTEKGGEPWWMGDNEENVVSPLVRFYGDIPGEEKSQIMIQAMALFPEIFSNSPTKYKRLSLWLASRHGIIASSLRDSFTAGGREDIRIDSDSYNQIPRIYKHLHENYDKVRKFILQGSNADLEYYWQKNDLQGEDLISIWIELVLFHTSTSFPQGRKFLIHLFGYMNPGEPPLSIKEEYRKYGF